MKIFFDNVDWSVEHTGPNCFAKRLAVQLGKMGHQLADPDDYDVALVFIEPTHALNTSKPYVQRLDGIWFKLDQMRSGMNDNIRRTYERASSVVWQSQFDCEMTTRWFERRDGHVIRNGIELRRQPVRSEQLIEMRSKYDKIFVCSSQWHPQKRLRDNIEFFFKVRERQFPNSCLIVLGNDPDYHVADKNVFFAGNIRHDLCAEIYATADYMIHLAWLDHCPNVVVEAISQSCPVICSSEGGTRELVELDPNNGHVIRDSLWYDFSLVDYDDPPRVLLDEIPTLCSKRAQPYTVDIVDVAKEYERVLASVL